MDSVGRGHLDIGQTFASDPGRCFQTPALTSQRESGDTGVISTQRQTQTPAGNSKTQAKPGKAAIKTAVSELCYAGTMVNRKTGTYYKMVQTLSGIRIKVQVR